MCLRKEEKRVGGRRGGHTGSRHVVRPGQEEKDREANIGQRLVSQKTLMNLSRIKQKGGSASE